MLWNAKPGPPGQHLGAEPPTNPGPRPPLGGTGGTQGMWLLMVDPCSPYMAAFTYRSMGPGYCSGNGITKNDLPSRVDETDQVVVLVSDLEYRDAGDKVVP
jgi:hypothetical protein